MTNPKISMLATKDLIPYARNTRTHSDEQVNQIVSSIKEFGFTNPVLVDQDNMIIAGHGRVMAANKLKLDKVPTICLKHLTEAQKKAYIIADNRLALNAGWDEDMLKVELEELNDLEFDISLLGFEDNEIESLLSEPTEGLTDEDAVPDLPEEPTTKLGDLWILGEHRLLCGDSTSIDDVDKLMDGNKADMVFTDPPYNIDYQGLRDKREKIINDKMHENDFEDFLIQSLMNPAQHLDKYFKQHEIIFYYGDFGGQKTLRGDIWELKRQKNTYHPTTKPVELIDMAIIDQPEKNKIYDGFGGSGSTLISCEKNNRKCFMMELSPKYCDVIIQRWEEFTGNKAELFNG
jgi:ParB-like chromosome segregation protein Spo0J